MEKAVPNSVNKYLFASIDEADKTERWTYASFWWTHPFSQGESTTIRLYPWLGLPDKKLRGACKKM
jgi:hypothetical protein